MLISQPLGKLATVLPLEDRDSFSSIMSSFLAMDSVVRFNIGQESRSELIEKFYACGKFLTPQTGRIAKEITWEMVRSEFVKLVAGENKDLRNALDDITEMTTFNTLASLLDFASRVFILNNKNQNDLATLISLLLTTPKARSAITSNVQLDLMALWLRTLLSTG